MLKNYHTHTYRCKHANGTDRAYVEAAIAANIKVLGFSDHIPYQYPKDFISPIRMELSELENYVTSIEALKKEYQKDIQIYLGFEAEYFSEEWEIVSKILSPYPIDYLILGQHFIGGERNGIPATRQTLDEAVLKQYVDSVILALSTDAFTYIAHPDILNFIGNADIYRTHMERLCSFAKAMQVPLEINLLGLLQNRTYPSTAFFEIAKEVGNTIVLGRDAHDPIAFFDDDTLNAAHLFANQLDLPITEDIVLRKPF